MAEINSGLRAVLASPLRYNALQDLMGGRRCRREFVATHIRPQAGDRLLDIGCGTAQLLDYLPGDIQYEGYDPSSAYIDFARKHHGARGTFHCGLYDDAAASRHAPFDIIIASGLLHHMDDGDVAKLLALVKRSLAQAGRFITIDPVYCAGQNPLARLLIDCDRGQNVRKGEQYSALMAAQFSRVSATLVHRKWPPYTHWIMECMA
jgi:SAM-dependent methyltransferase